MLRSLSLALASAFAVGFPSSVVAADKLPEATLPPGWTLELAAGPPLVQHPIMGCLDDQGRMFVCDSSGVNLKKDELEKQRPHRVVLLTDTDKDGRFDKASTFADQLTFPQGACWLDGSLYVGSPPSLWRFTDADGDGVAEKREELVTGFDYTGNAADIHGPFFNPTNGRLYWCHGRKGHKVQRVTMENGQRTLGPVIHEGLACGIWSCKPDGSDIGWHSLGCGDNPVEVVFTPDGDVLGVQNLYYNRPRGDTLVHWLYGGLYERADQIQAIAKEQRTLETMPVIYNFGHVAVSGCCLSRFIAPIGSQAQTPVQQLYVTHFNTQRLVRVELRQEPGSATFKASEHEFLKLHNPDIHLTDVMEQPDGSLLLLDTGGWFRIGCPSSMMEKPDILGAIYRLKPKARREAQMLASERAVHPRAIAKLPIAELVNEIRHSDIRTATLAAQALAQRPQPWPIDTRKHVVTLLRGETAPDTGKRVALDATTEHAAMFLAVKCFEGILEPIADDLPPEVKRRLLIVNHRIASSAADLATVLRDALSHLDNEDAALARAALEVAASSSATAKVTEHLDTWLQAASLKPSRLRALQGYATAIASQPSGQALIATLLRHRLPEVQNTALAVIAATSTGKAAEAWVEPMQSMLILGPSKRPALLDAIAKAKAPAFDSALQTLASDAKAPMTQRLKALSANSSLAAGTLDASTFALLTQLLGDGSNPAARLTAAEMLSKAKLDDAQLASVLAALATCGPLELGELLAGFRKYKAEQAKPIAEALAKAPALGSIQESVIRTIFSAWPESIYDLVRPAIANAAKAHEAKRAHLDKLADPRNDGDPTAGKALFESGAGTCIACHQIAGKGRAIGPDLSKIGAIRSPRDLFESILFPSNTLARDYEQHAIELSDGSTLTGIVKSHSAEGLILMDAAGQEKPVPHDHITADVTLPLSLMPQGLDTTMTEEQLRDLVAYLTTLN